MQITDKFSSYAKRKAVLVTSIFSLWSMVAAIIYITDGFIVWPLVFFQILLIINTFFSVRAFSSIIPHNDLTQGIVDILLALCYFTMPLFFNNPTFFVLIALLLFVLASLKYIFAILLVGFSKLFYEKIRIDVLGILLCFFILVGILSGYAYVASLLFVIIFLLANIYLFFVKPLYRLENHNLK